jgi:hypothetical protein
VPEPRWMFLKKTKNKISTSQKRLREKITTRSWLWNMGIHFDQKEKTGNRFLSISFWIKKYTKKRRSELENWIKKNKRRVTFKWMACWTTPVIDFKLPVKRIERSPKEGDRDGVCAVSFTLLIITNNLFRPFFSIFDPVRRVFWNKEKWRQVQRETAGHTQTNRRMCKSCYERKSRKTFICELNRW